MNYRNELITTKYDLAFIQALLALAFVSFALQADALWNVTIHATLAFINITFAALAFRRARQIRKEA